MISGSGQGYAVVSIQLWNCPAPALVPGYAFLVSTTQTIQANSSGVISGAVWPNDVISCAGTTGGSQYRVTFLVNGIPAQTPQCYSVLSTQGTWNLNTQQPVSCTITQPSN